MDPKVPYMIEEHIVRKRRRGVRVGKFSASDVAIVPIRTTGC